MRTHFSQRNPHLADLALDTAQTRFVQYCTAKNLSDNTVAYYQFRLLAFTRYLDAHAIPPTLSGITTAVLRDFLTCEKTRSSASTAKHAFITLRAFFRFLIAEGVLPTSPLAGIENVKQKRTVLPTFTPEDIDAMLATCGKDFIGLRDWALLLVLVDCGLRLSEVSGLSLEDITWSEGTMLVTGKGDKERRVPFGQATKSALLKYLDRRGTIDGEEACFVNCFGTRLLPGAIRSMVKAHAMKAGISGVRCSPHTFRHTFAVMFLRNGGDVFSLQKILGHTDLTMTRRYAELSQADVIAKHRQFSPGDRFLPAVAPAGGRKRLK